MKKNSAARMSLSVLRLIVTVLLGGAVLSPGVAGAVNLVPNPGFETLTQCPPSFSWLFVAWPWDAPTTGTSDCLNTCSTGPFAPGVPQNPVGYQTAHGGAGYAGFILRSAWAGNNEYREYIEAPLASPMSGGQTYLVTFYVSLGDSSYAAIDRIGAYFSIGAVGPIGNYLSLPFTPQVESPAGNFLTNMNGWTLVSGSFVAAGGEDHIVLGNFHDDANTATQPAAGPRLDAYYYVDDISVELQVPVEQACCLPDGGCSMQFPAECQLLGGWPAGPGTTCTPTPCDPTPAGTRTWGSLKTLHR